MPCTSWYGYDAHCLASSAASLAAAPGGMEAAREAAANVAEQTVAVRAEAMAEVMGAEKAAAMRAEKEEPMVVKMKAKVTCVLRVERVRVKGYGSGGHEGKGHLPCRIETLNRTPPLLGGRVKG